MTQIEKIKSEIERQIAECERCANAAAEKNLHNTLEANELLIRKYKKLLSFIESLEQERVPESEESGTQELTEEEMLAALRLEYDKGRCDVLMELADAPKIRGWVARDKNGALYLHNDKPFQTKTLWAGATYIALSADMFPELRFEDNPIEVELTLKPIKNG